MKINSINDLWYYEGSTKFLKSFSAKFFLFIITIYNKKLKITLIYDAW